MQENIQEMRPWIRLDKIYRQFSVALKNMNKNFDIGDMRDNGKFQCCTCFY